jgi:O-antigen/teichoic acid export membrane protein
MEDPASPLPTVSTTPLDRMMERAKELGRFVSVQILAQAIGVVSGILLVRTLSRSEYAFFTIANSMQGTMNLLADTGLSIGLTSIGGKVWQDRHRFGQLINTTMRLRRYFAAIAVTVVTPILVWMLVTNGSTYGYAAAVTAVVLVGLNYQLTIGVFGVVPRLLTQVSRLQRADLFAALLRLVVLAVAYSLLLNAVTAVLASVVALALQDALLKRWAADGIDTKAPMSDADRRALLKIVKNLMPTTIFYCVQGQITIWLMSFFGGTQRVAEIGALGRLGIMFSIVASVMTTIVVPRFARYQAPGLLKRRFLQITSGFIAFGLALVALAALLPGPLLWILGSKYALLERELLLMMILTAVNSVVGAMWSLNSAKAWIEYAWLHIPSTLAAQAFLLWLLDVSTLRGALLFGILSLIPTIILNVGLAIRGLRSAARSDYAAASPS